MLPDLRRCIIWIGSVLDATTEFSGSWEGSSGLQVDEVLIYTEEASFSMLHRSWSSIRFVSVVFLNWFCISKVVYVDELVINGSEVILLDHVNSCLSIAFDMTDLSPLHICPGVKFLEHRWFYLRVSNKVCKNLVKEGSNARYQAYYYIFVVET